MTEQCGTCRFFKGHAEAVRGDCRRFPPTVAVSGGSIQKQYEDMYAEQQSGNSLELYHDTSWPVVDLQDWCGEYQEKRYV